MYSPFREEIFKRVIDNLADFKQETAHKVLLAYSCPLEVRQLERHKGYVKLKEHQVIEWELSWNLWECQTKIGQESTAAIEPQEEQPMACGRI